MSVRIRRAREDEIEAIATLCAEAYEEMASGLDPGDYHHQVARVSDVATRFREGELLVAEDGGDLAGTIAYYGAGKHGHDRVIWECAMMRMLAVAPAFRGRGIARLLAQECVVRAQKDGATAIALQTSELTPVAVGMYERIGFRRTQEFELYKRKYWIYALPMALFPPYAER